MEPGVTIRFEKGSVYSRAQIHEVLGGGGRASLPTRGGEVVCACMLPGKNPRAPREMLIGGRERSVRLARAFAASGKAVPVFVRVRAGVWAYVGTRRVCSVIDEPGALLALIAEGAPPDTALALLLEEDAQASANPDGPAAAAPAGTGR